MEVSATAAGSVYYESNECGRGVVMPKYTYVAKDVQGKKIRGELNAGNETALYEALRADNKFLISSRLSEDTGSRHYKMKAAQLSDFCRQLGTLLEAGVSLVRALNIIQQEDTIKPEQKAIYADMLRRIRQGEAFSEAMAAQGHAFPELLINMFKASEESGSMDKTAMRMADHYQKEYRLNSKIKSATMYPKILCVIVVIVILIVFYYIIPEFVSIFENMELPLVTRILLAISEFLVQKWFVVVIAAAVIFFGTKALLKLPGVRLQVDKYKLKIPKIGMLLRTIYTARFARTLCSLYTSGLPIVSALQVGKETVGNKYLESQFDDAIAMVRRGESLSAAIDSIDGFHKKLANSVAIGEETGSLDTMLISTADNFDYDSEMAISKLVGYLEPVMIILMAVVIGIIMVAVMVPLTNMYSEIEASGSM